MIKYKSETLRVLISLFSCLYILIILPKTLTILSNLLIKMFDQFFIDSSNFLEKTKNYLKSILNTVEFFKRINCNEIITDLKPVNQNSAKTIFKNTKFKNQNLIFVFSSKPLSSNETNNQIKLIQTFEIIFNQTAKLHRHFIASMKSKKCEPFYTQNSKNFFQ